MDGFTSPVLCGLNIFSLMRPGNVGRRQLYDKEEVNLMTLALARRRRDETAAKDTSCEINI